MNKVYCLECRKMGCEKSVPSKTGFIFVNGSGVPSSAGEKLRVGFHSLDNLKSPVPEYRA